MTKRYKYHVVDRCGRCLEADLPTRHSAEVYIQFLRDTESIQDLSIVEEHVPAHTGLGRDPDLH